TRCLSDWSSDVCSSDLLSPYFRRRDWTRAVLSATTTLSRVVARLLLANAAPVAKSADRLPELRSRTRPAGRALPCPPQLEGAPRSEERRVGKAWRAPRG